MCKFIDDLSRVSGGLCILSSDHYRVDGPKRDDCQVTIFNIWISDPISALMLVRYHGIKELRGTSTRLDNDYTIAVQYQQSVMSSDVSICTDLIIALGGIAESQVSCKPYDTIFIIVDNRSMDLHRFSKL